MSSRIGMMGAAMGMGLMLAGGSASAAVFEVGAGKTYTTIQGALDAAAGQTGAEIVVDGGTYTENLSIAGQNGVTEGWTIRAATGEHVVLNGSVSWGNYHDNSTMDGINLWMDDSANGHNFGYVSRSNHLKNLWIYGGADSTKAAVAGSSNYGTMTLEQVTIYNAEYGISAGYAMNVHVNNSIIAFSDTYGAASGNSYGNQNPSLYFANSDVYGSGVTNFVSDGAEGDMTEILDQGGNLNWSAGLDPLFASTDPNSPNFLMLQQGSPAATASSNGSYIGARGVLVPEPATLGLIGLGGLAMLRRRR